MGAVASPAARAEYHFVSRWLIDAPIDRVWQEISRPEEWPRWWRGVLQVETIEPGGDDDVGAYRRMTWRSQLPYRLRLNIRTVRVDKPRSIEAHADGELAGVGKWTLFEVGGRTRIRYDWTVDARRWWMRWFRPVARPLFVWNHDVIMRWGLAGLGQRLRAAVLDESDW